MRKEHYNRIKNESGLSDKQMTILQPHLDIAFKIPAELIEWQQECQELMNWKKKLPELELILDSAKQAVFDVVMPDLFEDDEYSNALPAAAELNCNICGGKILAGVCLTCG